MKRSLSAGAVAAAVFAAAAIIGGSAPAQEAAKRDGARGRFVVHEWGTFTSVQGSDGLALEGLQHEEERLSSFVYSRTKVRDCPLRKYGYKGLEVPVSHVTQKMETPVLYFHTDVRRKVRVRVDFVGGLISQWYPVSNLLGPPEGAHGDGPLDLKTVGRSFLEWDVDLVPRQGGEDRLEPVAADDPWRFARDVDSAVVRTAPRSAPDRKGPVEAEKFLFYRGLGTFATPIKVTAKGGGRALISDDGEFPIGRSFVLEMTQDKGRVASLEGVAARGAAEVDLSNTPFSPKDVVVEGLKSDVRAALGACGLYDDEARAMVSTWSRQWFGTEGLRVIYVLPSELTWRLLPLDISPKPDDLVRVLVGRVECLSPEVEAEVTAALRDRSSKDPAAAAAATARLMRLDRFLEPHVRRVLATSSDPVVRANGEALLASLR